MIRAALARKTAEEELSAIGALRPPTDLEAIAERNGLRILRQRPLAPGVRAQLQPAAGLIEVAALGPVVERFAIAHEIGHALLDHGDQTCFAAAIAESVPLDEADVGISFEAEASAFASHLLVTRRWLRDFVAAGIPIDELQAIFAVTRPVLMIAITDARLLNKVTPSRR